MSGSRSREASPPKVSRDIPKAVDALLSAATNRHKKLSMALADIKGHITTLENSKTTNTIPAFLRNIPAPECRLTNFAEEIQKECNLAMKRAHEKHIINCLDKIICARKTELEATRLEIINIENNLNEEVDEYLATVKEVQLSMSVNPSDSQKKLNTESSRIKTILTKEFKSITMQSIRQMGLDKTNQLIQRKKISANKEKAEDVIELQDTDVLMEKLIERKIQALITKGQLTNTPTNKVMKPYKNKNQHTPGVQQYQRREGNKPQDKAVLHNDTGYNKQNKFTRHNKNTGYKHPAINNNNQTNYNHPNNTPQHYTQGGNININNKQQTKQTINI